MKASNLPPFYVGQKVVCIEGYPNPRFFKKGDQFTILDIIKTPCCNMWIVNIGVSMPYKNTICDCGQTFKANQMFRASRFAPIEKQNIPLMTFSQIKEKEKEQILIDN